MELKTMSEDALNFPYNFFLVLFLNANKNLLHNPNFSVSITELEYWYKDTILLYISVHNFSNEFGIQ